MSDSSSSNDFDLDTLQKIRVTLSQYEKEDKKRELKKALNNFDFRRIDGFEDLSITNMQKNEIMKKLRKKKKKARRKKRAVSHSDLSSGLSDG